MAQKDPYSNDEVVTVGGEGGEREEGSVKVVEGVVSLTVTDPSPVGGEDGGERGVDKIALPPVTWDSVSSLVPHYQTTIKERMPALFPECCKGTLFAGALYAHTARGKPIDEQPETSRLVYFGGCTPEKPGMRVAKTSLGEETVLRYSWNRINFMYSNVTHALGSSEYTFQIFTPDISGTYGLQATDRETIFEKLPEGREREEYFTLFQITTRESTNHITTQNSTLGMYVDTKDGWKMKLTKKKDYWDKFRIGGFKPPLAIEVTANPELPMAQCDGTSSHWNPMHLDEFICCGSQYVYLFQSQVPYFVNCDAWNTQKDNLRFASIRGFVPGASEALYLCPNTMSGMLSCSMHQSGPYLPTKLNDLEFNFVLYNKTPPYDPWNLTMSLFTPKFQHNYSLKVEEVHCSGSQCLPPPNRADVKFLCDPELHPINCLPTANGRYNISIEAYNKHTYWLYFEVVNSTVVVKAFLDDGSPNLPAKAEFDFQSILVN